MPRLEWDKVGERVFETGCDRGVLYIPTNGDYQNGVSWSGLTNVTESPSGAEPTPVYADNMKYLNLMSAEDFGANVEAITYPPEFAQFDGGVVLHGGITLGQQPRKSFGLSYRTKVGNDVNPDAGYKLHLVYGCLAAPSERAYGTVNDTPEAVPFSWDMSTTAVAVSGQKPTSLVVADSTKLPEANMIALENALYGTVGTNPRLPLPDEVIAMFAGALTSVTPPAPTYTPATRTITLPTTAGVVWRVNGIIRTNSHIINIGEYGVVTATPAAGHRFPDIVQDRWVFGPGA